MANQDNIFNCSFKKPLGPNLECNIWYVEVQSFRESVACMIITFNETQRFMTKAPSHLLKMVRAVHPSD